ncbi:MAG TPA: hypothetical protein VKB16_11425, partial [Beijerinckiaceae bacterium]|nr:hypothetical protein [Beijerinckiaceae bacterium]
MTRNSASGTTHSSGAAAMSVEMRARDGDEKAGRNEGEADPAGPLPPPRRRVGGRRAFAGGRRARPRARAAEKPAAADEDRERGKAHEPACGLLLHPEERLDRERVGDEGRKRADIRGGVEEIRIGGARMTRAREPGLEQRPVGGEGEERQPDRDGEEAEQPERLAVRRRARPAGRDGDRQAQAGAEHEREMQRQRRAGRGVARQEMGIAVAGEQKGLEEHQRDRPHRGRPAEHRQHHLGEHRLHGEKQQRRQEQRRGKERHARRARRRAHCGRDSRLDRGR